MLYVIKDFIFFFIVKRCRSGEGNSFTSEIREDNNTHTKSIYMSRSSCPASTKAPYNNVVLIGLPKYRLTVPNGADSPAKI